MPLRNLFGRIVFGIVALLLCSTGAHAEWFVPSQPNPTQILQEARNDTAAGRYDDALSKFVWFHRNALKYQKNLEGVRVSFALSYWKELGDVYLPARDQMFAARDAAFDGVKLGGDAVSAFRDLAAINRVVQQPQSTADAFVWVDSNKPSLAPAVLEWARTALIQTGAYELCAKYLDPEATLDRQLEVYRSLVGRGNNPKQDPSLLSRATAAFSREAGMLVALLVKVKRPEDAQKLADRAQQAVPDEGLQAVMKRALAGEMPQ